MHVHMRFFLQLCIVLGAMPQGAAAAAALLGIRHSLALFILLHVVSSKNAHLFKAVG